MLVGEGKTLPTTADPKQLWEESRAQLQAAMLWPTPAAQPQVHFCAGCCPGVPKPKGSGSAPQRAAPGQVPTVAGAELALRDQGGVWGSPGLPLQGWWPQVLGTVTWHSRRGSCAMLLICVDAYEYGRGDVRTRQLLGQPPANSPAIPIPVSVVAVTRAQGSSPQAPFVAVPCGFRGWDQPAESLHCAKAGISLRTQCSH